MLEVGYVVNFFLGQPLVSISLPYSIIDLYSTWVLIALFSISQQLLSLNILDNYQVILSNPSLPSPHNYSTTTILNYFH